MIKQFLYKTFSTKILTGYVHGMYKQESGMEVDGRLHTRVSFNRVL